LRRVGKLRADRVGGVRFDPLSTERGVPGGGSPPRIVEGTAVRFRFG